MSVVLYLLRPVIHRRMSGPKILLLLLLSCLVFLFAFPSFYQHTVLLFRRQSTDLIYRADSSETIKKPGKLEPEAEIAPQAPTPSPQKCVLPPLQLDDPLLMSFVKKLPPLRCPFATLEWVHVQNGTLVYSKEAIAKVGNFTCDVFPLIRPPKDDNRVRWGTKIQNFISGSQLTSDFIKVECRRLNRPVPVTPPANQSLPAAAAAAVGGAAGARAKPQIVAKPPSLPNNDYVDILMGVAPNNQAVWERLKKTKPPANGLSGLSVVMLGFDSMSRMSWLRRMKSTREYLVNSLGGIELEGYNIMGDGTPAALFPILTGHHEEELPESRRNHRGAKPVDDYPWIWKDFTKVGYVTSWADASVNIAPFNYRLLGFSQPPTDYFARPYYLALRDYAKYPSHATDCRAATPKYQDWFNWVKDIFHMYRDHPKFMMHFYATLSHNDNNRITMADEDFRSFLESLERQGYLNSTILVVFGDHGARYDVLRATWAGRLEERLPYMNFRFPPWFERKYPQLMQNFRTNVHRLTTPMDIHETLHDVIKFDGAGQGDVRNRGISLFKKIPIERECKHADIRNHWCACLDWRKIENPETDTDGQRALQTAVGFINNLTEPHRDLCARLEIEKVTSGQVLQANEDFLKFSKALNKDGRLPILDQKSKSNMRERLDLYQMTFMTKPGKGLFEVTVAHKDKSAWKTSEKDISRINKYGDAPSCILGINRQLRQYCYCNSLVGKS
ncbi:hypothetical protein ElyMa_003873700 [Elysia marginata]|uniref:Sulfatase N-terminal domain-containing protein n=1 Tax=Elysia marginata TaxID=1093978 RepID=A0AAV4FLV9_9GAST|nr:hypothetical protein ElyMa_003873700 [Elysia marginata]